MSIPTRGMGGKGNLVTSGLGGRGAIIEIIALHIRSFTLKIAKTVGFNLER